MYIGINQVKYQKRGDRMGRFEMIMLNINLQLIQTGDIEILKKQKCATVLGVIGHAKRMKTSRVERILMQKIRKSLG